MFDYLALLSAEIPLADTRKQMTIVYMGIQGDFDSVSMDSFM